MKNELTEKPAPGAGHPISPELVAVRRFTREAGHVAEFERAIIRERVTAGLRAAKANGVKLGRPETLTEHLPAVAELVRQGLGVRAIARELGLPTASAFKLVKQGRTNGSLSPASPETGRYYF